MKIDSDVKCHNGFSCQRARPLASTSILARCNRETVIITSGVSRPFPRLGRRLASMIPEARFVPLESNNHLLMKGEPAWPRFVEEVRRFLGCEIASPLSTAQTSGIRTCPTCGRIFTDESLNYCLDDGTRLAVSTDNASTQILRTLSDM
jgi:hypothetical protein